MPITNFQFSIFNFQFKPQSALFFILFLFELILPPGLARSFAPPQTGVVGQSSSTSRDLIKNITDREIFKKYSITKSIKVDKDTLNREPVSFLSNLSKDMAGHEFELIKKELNGDLAVYHYRQLHQTLPVFGGEIVLRISKKEGTIIITGYFFKDIRIPVEPIYRVPTLVNIAKKILNGGKPEGTAQLGILPADDGFYMCYKIRIIKDIAEDYIFYMDALTGGVLRAFNQVDTGNN